MNLRSVTDHPSFLRGLAWVGDPRGEPPSPWLPQGLARLDDTWLAEHPERGARRPPPAAVEALPEPLRRRARAACGLSADCRSRLPATLGLACARWCWSDLVDQPPASDDEPALLARARATGDDAALASALPQLSGSTVLRAVSIAGLEDLGGLLAHAPDRTAATICGRLPEPWRKRVWQARTTSARPDRDALAQLRHLISTGDPTEALFTLGALHFAGLLSRRPLALQQTAQLLPVVVARHLLQASADPAPPDTATMLQALDEAAQDADGSLI